MSVVEHRGKYKSFCRAQVLSPFLKDSTRDKEKKRSICDFEPFIIGMSGKVFGVEQRM